MKHKKQKKHRVQFQTLLLLGLGVFFSSGYRIAQSEFGVPMRWDVTKERPVLWVEVCDDLRAITFEHLAFPKGDPLEGETTLATDEILSSIFADVNASPGSFLELRWAGDEHLGDAGHNPPTSEERYSSEAALHRTITVCTGSTTYAQSAHASPRDNTALCQDGDSSFAAEHPEFCRRRQVASCAIGADRASLSIGSDIFVHILTHELGHCLGLMHNHETHESVMSYLANRPRTIRLTLDDQAGLAFLYPENPSQVRQTADFGLSSCTAKPH